MPLLFAYGINRFSNDVAQNMIIQRNNKMKFIRNRSRLLCHRHRIFNDDILSSNICIPLLSVFLLKKEKKEQKNKRNRKINTQKTRDRTRNLSITSLAFYHCTDAYVEELLPKETSKTMVIT